MKSVSLAERGEIVVSTIRTQPFSSEEIEGLTEEKVDMVLLGGYEKVLDEVVVERISVSDAAELRRKLLAICERPERTAVIVYTGNILRERFLFDEGADPRDPDAVLELVIFKKAKASEPVIEIEPESIQEALEISETHKVSQIKSKQRLNAIPEITLEVSPGWIICVPSKIIKENDSILCRIISKDRDAVKMTNQYFRQLHGLSVGVGSVSNSLLLRGYSY